VGGCGLDSSGLGYGPVAGSCEHSTEPSGSIIGWEFLHYLSDYYVLEYLAPWCWLIRKLVIQSVIIIYFFE
jgi:hypothetical protein